MDLYNIKINTISQITLGLTLKEWDSYLNPRISDAVKDVDEYAKKIYQNADIIEAYNNNNELIGLLCIYLNQSVGFITLFVVKPDFQHKGVGSLLINSAEKLAISKNINKIKLECFKENITGQKFYTKKLYKPTIGDNKIFYEKILLQNITPLVSILCIAYNQANFIKQCLDGFVMQKTNFPFEVLIHDDASTDGTDDIIREYEKKYPDIIKPIYQTENQWSKGDSVLKKFVYPKAKSKYVALCEGDDYWTDPYKLQKQVDFLEAHPEYSGCFHPVKVIWENGEHKDSIYPSKRKMRWKKFVTKEDLLKTNYIQTNSILYRWAFLEKDIKDYYPDKILPGDLYLHLLHAQYGDIAFLPDVMAVYRRHESGIWFDGKNRMLKYGTQIVNFYYNAWKNFTGSSEKYLNERVLPTIVSVSDTYYKNQKFEELNALKNTYNDLYTRALSFAQTGSSKYKKYKNLFNWFLVISIILSVLNIVQFILYKL